MVPAPDGTWVYYDYVPEEHDIRSGKPEVTGKICVIGSKLDEDKLAELFRKKVGRTYFACSRNSRINRERYEL